MQKKTTLWLISLLVWGFGFLANQSALAVPYFQVSVNHLKGQSFSKGGNYEAQLVLKNIQSYAITPTGFYEEKYPAEFQITDKSDCLNKALQPGKSCTIKGTFKPSQVGQYTWSFKAFVNGLMRSDGYSASVEVKEAPLLEVKWETPLPNLFVVGSPAVPVVLGLQNVGKVSIDLPDNAVTWTKNQEGDFGQLTTTCGKSLAPSEKCAYTWYFNPGAGSLIGVTKSLNAVVNYAEQEKASPSAPTMTKVVVTSVVASWDQASLRSPFYIDNPLYPAQAISITYRNTTSYPAYGFLPQVVRASSDDFTGYDASNCPTTLMGNASCQVKLSYYPVTPGNKSIYAFARFAGGTVDNTTTLTSTALGTSRVTAKWNPDLPSNAVLGQPAMPVTLTFTNTSADPASNFKVDLTQQDVADFSLVENTCASLTELKSGAECSITYQFAPQKVGTKFIDASATFSQATGTVLAPSNRSSVSVASNVSAQISGLPASFLMGFDKPSTVKVTYTNTSNFTVYGLNWQVLATDDQDFVKDSAGVTCTNQLDPGASCTVPFTYAPKASGNKFLTAMGSFTGGNISAVNSHTSVARELPIVTASWVDNGASDLPSQSLAKVTNQTATVVFTNTSTQYSAEIFSASVTPGGEGSLSQDFTAGLDTCQSLANHILPPKGTCTISYSFHPQTQGQKWLTAAASFDASGQGIVGPQQTTVSTAKLQNPLNISVSPTALTSAAFVNKTVETLTVTYTNISLYPLAGFIPTMTVNEGSTGSTGDFELNPGDCQTGNLEAGKSCIATLTYHPHSSGSKKVTLGSHLSGESVTLSSTAYALAVSITTAPATLPEFSEVGKTYTVSVTYRNTGEYTLSDFSSQFDADTPELSLTSNCKNVLLEVGNSCVETLTFKPVGAGLKKATLSGTNVLKTEVLSSTAQNPPPSTYLVAEWAVNMPTDALVNQAYQPVTLRVKNSSSTITLSNVKVSSVLAGQVDPTDLLTVTADPCNLTAGATLAPDAVCEVSYEWTPKTEGEKFIQSTITSSEGGSLSNVESSHAKVQLPEQVTFSIEPASLTNPASVNETVDQLKITYKNKSIYYAANNLTAQIKTEQPNDFSLVGCQAATLPPQSTCQASLLFKPLSAGQKQVSITGSFERGNLPSVSLSSSAEENYIKVNWLNNLPATAFVNQTALPIKIQFSNLSQQRVASDFSVKVLAASNYVGNFQDDFQFVKSTCNTQLSAGATCEVDYTFQPKTLGNKQLIASALFDANKTAYQNSQIVVVGPSPLVATVNSNLPSEAIVSSGQTSLFQLGLTNKSQLTLTHFAVVITKGKEGEIEKEFEIPSNFQDACATKTTLKPAEVCYVLVRFTPLSEGEKFLSVSATFDNGGKLVVESVHTAAKLSNPILLSFSGNLPSPYIPQQTSETIGVIYKNQSTKYAVDNLLAKLETITAEDFELQGCQPSTSIPPQGQCVALLTFKPKTATGEKKAALSATFSRGTVSSQTLSSQQALVSLELTPSILEVSAGNTVSLVVKNPNSSNIPVKDITLDTTNVPFMDQILAISPSKCSVLLPGESCTFTFQIKPDAAGGGSGKPAIANLNILSLDAKPASVQLTINPPLMGLSSDTILLQQAGSSVAVNILNQTLNSLIRDIKVVEPLPIGIQSVTFNEGCKALNHGVPASTCTMMVTPRADATPNQGEAIAITSSNTANKVLTAKIVKGGSPKIEMVGQNTIYLMPGQKSAQFTLKNLGGGAPTVETATGVVCLSSKFNITKTASCSALSGEETCTFTFSPKTYEGLIDNTCGVPFTVNGTLQSFYGSIYIIKTPFIVSWNPTKDLEGVKSFKELEGLVSSKVAAGDQSTTAFSFMVDPNKAPADAEIPSSTIQIPDVLKDRVNLSFSPACSTLSKTSTPCNAVLSVKKEAPGIEPLMGDFDFQILSGKVQNVPIKLRFRPYFMAVGSGGTFIASHNGMNWKSSATTTYLNFMDITYGADGNTGSFNAVAVNQTGSEWGIYRTTDGVSWVNVAKDSSAAVKYGSASRIAINSLSKPAFTAFYNDKNGKTHIANSHDGLNWSFITKTDNNVWNQLAFNNANKIYAVGLESNYPCYYYQVFDGNNWINGSAYTNCVGKSQKGNANNVKDMRWISDFNNFVMISYRNSSVPYLVLGNTDSLETGKPDAEKVIAYKDVKTGGMVNVLPNAFAWSPSLKTLVFVANGGVILKSSTASGFNSITFEKMESGLAGTLNLQDVIWSPGMNLFVAVGDNGTVLTSSDGITWTKRESNTTQTLTAVTSVDA